MGTARANWYPDPQHPGFLRYWDGKDWTGDLVPAPASDVAAQTPPGVSPVSKVPLFGARAHAKRQSQDLAAALVENQRLRAELASLGGLEVAELQRRREQIAAQISSELARLDSVRTQVINTEEEQVLQEIGVYRYRHPLSDVVAYQAALRQLQDEIKSTVAHKDGAVEAWHDWEVNGSAAQGRKLTREYSKLMLRKASNILRK